MAQRKKRQPYRYDFNGTIITTWKKLYRSESGAYCHRSGDFLVPVSPGLMTRISLAQLEGMTKGEK